MISRKTILYLLILLLLSSIPLLDLLIPGVFISHDFGEHAARLASFYKSLSEGNLFPRWGGNLNKGYGHPVLMFLYPLSNYLGSILHFLGFSFVESIKILFILGFIFSGIFMFFWIREVFGEKAGIIAAVFYLFAPYRFVNLYVRASLGEHLAYVFLPLVCWMLTKKKVVLGGISLALLILSHNAVSLMFLPFILVYCFYLAWAPKKKRPLTTHHPLLTTLLTLFLGFSLSAFFWFPALWEGKYTLRNLVTTREIFQKRYITLDQLFFSPWGYGTAQWEERRSGFSVQIGFAQWLVFFASLPILLNLFKERKKEAWLLLIGLLNFLVAIFLMLKISSPLLSIFFILPRFQFPWRLLSIPVFMASIFAAFLIRFSSPKWQRIALILLIFLPLISNRNYWHIKGIDTSRAYTDEYFLNEYPGTTETGESTPRWALRFQEKRPKRRVEVVKGKAKIKVEKWLSNEHLYTLEAEDETWIADNTLYFPGWKAFVDGKEVSIQFQDPNWRGIITFPVPSGKHQVKVVFTETRARLFADIVSLLALFGLGGFSLVKLFQ